jgi:EAL domain-containing protein (putative c-di-GMP-specific phosphodiesterase class I)
VAGVASTAELLGMAAIAEGVERQDQADQLIGLGYTLAQGFHFARPMTADAIQAALLEDDRATTPVA